LDSHQFVLVGLSLSNYSGEDTTNPLVTLKCEYLGQNPTAFNYFEQAAQWSDLRQALRNIPGLEAVFVEMAQVFDELDLHIGRAEEGRIPVVMFDSEAGRLVSDLRDAFNQLS
jgi:hypothetical protein